MPSAQSPFTTRFDDRVQELLSTWHVPGLAVAVIDGSSTFSKGYGFAVLPDTPVTPETVFFTASTTKSFTAASVSLLIDENPDLKWTSTLSSVIEDDFVLSDSSITSQVTFEDALSNRTGLSDNKFSFGPRSNSVKDAVRSLRHLPLAADLREKYLYSSYMFTAVSHAVETLIGSGLGDFMNERLWRPLGMKYTYWTPQQVAADSETILAHGYAWDAATESFNEQPVPDFPAVSGAGAMISNVIDYTKWLRCMMNKSSPLSRAAHETLIEPRIHFTEAGNNPFPPPHAYALGWTIDTYRGHRVIWHGGSWTGFGSVMMYVPDLQWGLVMMGNTTGTSNCVQISLFMDMLDGLVGTPSHERVNWSSELEMRISNKRRDHLCVKERLYPSLPSQLSCPSISFVAHAGRYSHPAYGSMNLELHGDTLIADRQFQEIPMMIRMFHVTGDSWLARLEILHQDPRDYESVKATFQTTAEGVARRVGLDLEPAVLGQMIWFDKVPRE
ncbi:beta-lactamase/transpeptidase-like protein [Penicillium sp. IBT 18751x]|nr:beta-lactamase/transpeptidase-like protein [Penicillium sp. IBT 18751x]